MPARVALVTGAARGIGAATARTLLERDYRVVAVDAALGDAHGWPGVDYPLGTEAGLASLVDKHGDAVLTVTGDVREPAVLDRAVAAATRTWGRLDAAVAVAAVIAGGRPQWETPDELLQTLWEVDLVGVWRTAASAVPAMLAGPDPSGCRFVAVASAAGTRGFFGLSAYTTVKHAVVGLVRGLAADLVGTGVTAVAVAPGATATRMLEATAALYDLDDPARLADQQLLRRPLDPDEVAATIAHCCSIEGAALNGAVVPLGGNP